MTRPTAIILGAVAVAAVLYETFSRLPSWPIADGALAVVVLAGLWLSDERASDRA